MEGGEKSVFARARVCVCASVCVCVCVFWPGGVADKKIAIS